MHDDFDESEMFSPEVAKRAFANTTPVAGSDNPLAGYFRLPGITVTLPTGGRFLPAGTLQLDRLGRLEIFALSGADEALLKSPDALMSGLAIEKMIESCAPGIKSPQDISAPDLDVILLAIRAASSGNTMPMEITCPACEEDNEFDVDLPTVLATVTPMPDELELRLSPDVLVGLQPHTLNSQTNLLIAAYEEARRAQMMPDDLDEAAKKAMLSATVDRVKRFQYESIANAISHVTTPSDTVINRKHIMEFVQKVPRQWQDALQEKIEEINKMGIDRSVEARCGSCEHIWKANIEFNPATFFGPSSSA